MSNAVNKMKKMARTMAVLSYYNYTMEKKAEAGEIDPVTLEQVTISPDMAEDIAVRVDKKLPDEVEAKGLSDEELIAMVQDAIDDSVEDIKNEAEAQVMVENVKDSIDDPSSVVHQIATNPLANTGGVAIHPEMPVVDAVMQDTAPSKQSSLVASELYKLAVAKTLDELKYQILASDVRINKRAAAKILLKLAEIIDDSATKVDQIVKKVEKESDNPPSEENVSNGPTKSPATDKIDAMVNSQNSAADAAEVSTPKDENGNLMDNSASKDKMQEAETGTDPTSKSASSKLMDILKKYAD